MQEADFTNKSDNATVANFTASHENKIVLIFCHKTKCGTTWEDCYCCINKKPEELCYGTMNECRSNCPIAPHSSLCPTKRQWRRIGWRGSIIASNNASYTTKNKRFVILRSLVLVRTEQQCSDDMELLN